MPNDPKLNVLLSRVRAERNFISTKYGIEILGIGGSVATGASSPNSDLDLGVRKSRQISLFEVVDAKEALTSSLGVDVDLVFIDFLNQYRLGIFMRDLVPL